MLSENDSHFSWGPKVTRKAAFYWESTRLFENTQLKRSLLKALKAGTVLAVYSEKLV